MTFGKTYVIFYLIMLLFVNAVITSGLCYNICDFIDHFIYIINPLISKTFMLVSLIETVIKIRSV